MRLISISQSAKDVAAMPVNLRHWITEVEQGMNGRAGAPSRLAATGVSTPRITEIFRYKI